jgi:predicted site-specific integrase-resolvase
MNRTSGSDASDSDFSDKDLSDEDSSDESPSDGDKRQDEQCRVGLYARVSTGEDRQTPETQLFRLREYADRRGFAIAEEYVDKASGLDSDRPEYQRLYTEEDVSINQISERLDISYGTAWNYVQEVKSE